MTAARVPLAVAFASAAVIAFQLVLMQLLAIAQWHHFAYMVISMALLGFGAAGTALALMPDFFVRHYHVALPALLLAAGMAMASTSWLVGLAGDFDAFLLFFDRGQVGLLLFYYAACCLPFFFAGLAITLAFYREVTRIGTLYFANLAGSGAGAVLVIGLLWMLPAARLAGLLALLLMAAAWMSQPTVRRTHAAIGAGALLLPLLSIAWPAAPASSEYKDIHGALQLPGARVTYRTSSPYGLLEAVSADSQRFAPSLSLRFRGEPPVRDVLFNDGEYFGTLLGRDAGRTGHILDHTTRALPYELRAARSVLVLNAATGNDVSHALSRGAGRIDAVEPHRQVNDLLQNRRPEWIDALYGDPAVRLHGSSARVQLGRAAGSPYDLVVLPVIGSFGGTAGVRALQEQYHLTLEAFRAMWATLGKQGMIAVTVWHEDPPRASLRLLATWRQLLDEQAVANRLAHVAAIRSWGTMTFLLSRAPFDRDERERLRTFGHAMAFDPLLLEDLGPDEREHYNRVGDRAWFEALDTLLAGDPEAYHEDALLNTRPARDDRPFFNHFIKLRNIPQLYYTYGARQLPYLELGFVLAGATFVQIVLAAVLLIVLPLFRLGWAGTRRRWTLAYFACLGIGFMFFEIVLIQKLLLYLDQPAYAAATVLTALLVSSGAGSWWSSRRDASARVLAGTGLLVAALIVLYTFGLRPVLGLSMGWPLAAKSAAVFLLLAPPAFFMGMMFPFGLRRLSVADARQIPWACAIDSCLSVSATALATLVALDAGFTSVMLAAGVAYLLAALAGPRLGADTPLQVGR
ncbi:MAG TPA: spermidine synthase-like protein [Gammaproteobacteria bacterium]|nr:spermidine synthase-like protein [Gammaproteobacteria bacterium]